MVCELQQYRNDRKRGKRVIRAMKDTPIDIGHRRQVTEIRPRVLGGWQIKPTEPCKLEQIKEDLTTLETYQVCYRCGMGITVRQATKNFAKR